ncbi:GDSL-type esterase/lipase family protein [Streptomyces sp. NPDC017638]|uniref:GDSL-type esterase/lipase family protein n=1 Tax=Streptomyces sp. NPDC017638 TaxID=3365004 RepID=UPI0037A4ADDA
MPGTDATYRRYVTLGDSRTEGLGDGDDTVACAASPTGWPSTSRTAVPGLRYTDLAVRGRLAAQIHAEQLAPAPALRPDVATVVAGVNDLLRPRFDAGHAAGHLEAVFAALTAQGAHVATFTFPTSPVSRR